jgi:hypothetical protein
VKDVMTPLEEYTTITEGQTVKDAILEPAEKLPVAVQRRVQRHGGKYIHYGWFKTTPI